MNLLLDSQKFVNNKSETGFFNSSDTTSQKLDSLDSIFVSNLNSHSMPKIVCNYSGKLNHLSTVYPYKTNPKGSKTKWVPKSIFKAVCFFMPLKARTSRKC